MSRTSQAVDAAGNNRQIVRILRDSALLKADSLQEKSFRLRNHSGQLQHACVTIQRKSAQLIERSRKLRRKRLPDTSSGRDHKTLFSWTARRN